MSSVTVTRESERGRRARRRRRQQRNHSPNENVEEPIIVESASFDGTCIDLTQEGAASDDSPVVIDLTSPIRVNDSPVVIIESIDRNLAPRRRHRQTSGDDSSLPPLPFRLVNQDYSAPSSSSTATPMSPKRPNISCPVCLDEAHVIKSSGRKIMSTVCGHVFCGPCIEGAVRIQKKCPTCRKTLHMNKVHELYI